MSNLTRSEREVSKLFNQMGSEYDLLIDLWYSWLFSRLHLLILKFLWKILDKRSPSSPLRCLDVGCGTGLQSVLLALCGADVSGVDIADRLIKVAQQKILRKYLVEDLFFSPFDYAHRYSGKARHLAREIRGERKLGRLSYAVGTGTNLPYASGTFDVVNCCGSTLNFIDDYENAIVEIRRVLKPGGFLLMEVENKYNLDLLWSVLDAILNKGGWFHQSLGEAWGNLISPREKNLRIDFPFTGLRGEEINMKIWLFSRRQLLSQLYRMGFTVIEQHSIHSATNGIPSIKLDATSPSMWILALFRVLRRFEEALGSRTPLKGLGCSLVIFAEKVA